MDKEEKDRTAKQRDVDDLIDGLVKSRLQAFLMGGGIIASVAFAMCVLGLITREATMTIGPDATASAATQLVGYANWTDFTAHCCCLVNTNAPSMSTLMSIEKWVCGNGRIKERVRARRQSKGSNVTVDGFSVRAMCSPLFATDCAVTRSGLNVQLACTHSRNATELELW